MLSYNLLDSKMERQNILLKAIYERMATIVNLNTVDGFENDFDFSLPVNTKIDLEILNNILLNADTKILLFKKLSSVGGNNIRHFTLRVIDSLMTSECLSEICWKGGGTSDKPGMITRYKNVLDVIIKTIKNKYANNGDVGSTVEICLKNKFRNSTHQKKIKNLNTCINGNEVQ